MASIVSGSAEARIVVENLKETQYILSRIDPELSGKLRSRMLRASNIIADQARAFTTSLGSISDGKGGISPIAENYEEAVAKITVKKARRGYQVKQNDKMGSIVEFAANGKTPQGVKLVEMLNRRYGTPGRFLWEAADQKKEEVFASVQSAISETIDEANDKIGRRVL